MDFARPVEAVVPGAQGRVLAVLAETSSELNLRTIARLSGVSVAHVSRVMPVLIDLGIVERREAPPSALFRYIPENVAARAISALADARRTALDELGEAAAGLDPCPVSVIIFGSVARGNANRESDLDVVVVRPDRVDEEDVGWRAALDHWVDRARRLTGNRVELLEVTEAEVQRRFKARSALWTDIEREGVVVHGRGIGELRGGRIA